MQSSAFVAAIVEANRSGAVIPHAAIAPPESLAAAMAAQAAIVAALGESPGGWKLGFSPAQVPVCGAMLASTMHSSGARLPLPAEGALLVEVEIAFRLARDLPPRPDRPYAAAEIKAAIDRVLIGIELLRGRMAEQPAPAFDAWLADRLGNAGYVTGNAVALDPQLDLSALRCRMWLDGALAHDKAGGHPQNDPLLPLLAYANAQCDGSGGLRAAQVVTTGSLIVPLRCDAPVLIEAEIEGIGRVALRLERR